MAFNRRPSTQKKKIDVIEIDDDEQDQPPPKRTRATRSTASKPSTAFPFGSPEDPKPPLRTGTRRTRRASKETHQEEEHDVTNEEEVSEVPKTKSRESSKSQGPSVGPVVVTDENLLRTDGGGKAKQNKDLNKLDK
ncbi:hypothetical protein M3Y94_01123500 [Aphelenchoides besseyi]|nr:hypothetical protein M3Y94_01123500 [Aphelenchoides besseyi]KAI6219277.1 hypothetical protein M3Y95_01122300 [Aphelenchoides besseyi]